MSSSSYAISAYVAPPGRDGLIFNRHDQAIALWKVTPKTIELARYWQLERVSGQKHHDWPILSSEDLEELVNSLLATEGLKLDDVQWTWGLPSREDENLLEPFAAQLKISGHTLSHLFSALLLDSRVMKAGTVVALAVDAGPDFVGQSAVPDFYYAAAVAQSGSLEIFPVESAGQIYEAACQFYGMEPGTLMAAAGICDCAFDASFDAIIRDRRFENRRDLIGVAPKAISEIDSLCRDAFAAGTATRCSDPRPTPREHFLSAVMKQIQAAATAIAERNIEQIVQKHDVNTRQAHLAIGGGFALNCPTNASLLNTFGFSGLHIPPAADDSGQAFGLGLAEMYLRGWFDERDFVFETPYVGSTDVAVDLPTDSAGGWTSSEFDLNRFVDDVSQGPIAWVDGRSELGPRALGHRSLLADPRRADHRDVLNRIKERQWWRPVAPIVLQERAGEWFDQSHRSPYMLETWNVLPHQRDVVPAIVHLDGSARVQTLSQEDDPRLYAVISGFADATGVPILCNTSLNAKGEPIIETVDEAVQFCRNHGVDVLYVAGRRLALTQQPLPPEAEPLQRTTDIFVRQERVLQELWDELALEGVTPEMLFLVGARPEFKSMLLKPEGRRRLEELGRFALRSDPDNADRVARFVESRGPGARFGLRPLQRYGPSRTPRTSGG